MQGRIQAQLGCSRKSENYTEETHVNHLWELIREKTGAVTNVAVKHIQHGGSPNPEGVGQGSLLNSTKKNLEIMWGGEESKG